MVAGQPAHLAQSGQARELAARLLQRLLGLLLRCDIHIGAGHPHRSPVAPLDDDAARQKPSQAAILVHHAVGNFERRRPAFDVRLRRHHHALAVIGMDALAPLVRDGWRSPRR